MLLSPPHAVLLVYYHNCPKLGFSWSNNLAYPSDQSEEVGQLSGLLAQAWDPASAQASALDSALAE